MCFDLSLAMGARFVCSSPVAVLSGLVVGFFIWRSIDSHHSLHRSRSIRFAGVTRSSEGPSVPVTPRAAVDTEAD